MKVQSAACAILISLAATTAFAQIVPDDAAGKRLACSTLGLAFHYSAAITDQSIKTLRASNGSFDEDFFGHMQAQSQKKTDMGNQLERRYGKASTDAQVADAKALSQKPLKPMWDMSEKCLN